MNTDDLSSMNITINDGLKAILARVPNERAFWHSILNAFSDPLFIVNEEKEIVFFNRKAEETTGFSESEVLGKTCLSGIRCVNCLRECALFKDGEVHYKDLEFLTREGRTIKVVKNASVIRDDAGNILGGIETFRDVTELKDLEDKQERERRFLRSILEGIGDGVLIIDSQEQVTFANERAAILTGYSEEELQGLGIDALFPPSIHEKLDDPALAERISTTVARKKKQNLSVQVRTIPLSEEIEGDGRHILLFRPITASERVQLEISDDHSYRGVISASPAMIDLFNHIENISDSNVTILIEGESGTGKEMIARAIHASSSRSDKPFNVVNCAVFNENLLESELFGHCKGAFTGAITDKIGRFELADGGTIFLDEIGELPANLQVKLLRFLQNREFERVGELKTRTVDVRIIAASNRNLREQIENGEFRDDLYYRLNVIPINLPPLRDRREDIPLLIQHFLKIHARPTQVQPSSLTDDAMMLMERYNWPGNVRELENAVLHALTCCSGQTISVRDLPRSVRVQEERQDTRKAPAQTVEEQESATILEALRNNGFNRTKTAEALGITRITLWRKMKKFGLMQ